jgi:hypothetical protein
MKSLYIALVDKYNQVVKSDSSSTGAIRFAENYNDSFTPKLEGTTTAVAIVGVFNFSGFELLGYPGSSYSNKEIAYL